jgi:malonyl CoA-acyl carrier protein transacylase
MTTRTDIALLFPGQGSQTPDMRDDVARELPDLLDRCIELVGEDPFARVDESTRFAQPAIFCASMAGWHKSDAQPKMAAGHSLGEIGALTAAGVVAQEDALELVVLRGKLMAEADDSGSMLALLGGTIEDAEAIANQAGVTVANDNAPGQVVAAGTPDGVDALAERARAAGIRKVMPLAVGHAFHTPLLADAADELAPTLAATPFRATEVPIVTNTDAAPAAEPSDWPALLARHLVEPVRWRETQLALAGLGATAFVEVGPGRVLAGLAKRTVPDVTVHNMATPDDVAAVAAAFTPAGAPR